MNHNFQSKVPVVSNSSPQSKAEESSKPQQVMTEKIPNRNKHVGFVLGDDDVSLVQNEDENSSENANEKAAIKGEDSNVHTGLASARAWVSEEVRDMMNALKSLKHLMMDDQEAGTSSPDQQMEPFFSWAPKKSPEEIRRFQNSPVHVLHKLNAS
jgi:hypothetical protein